MTMRIYLTCLMIAATQPALAGTTCDLAFERLKTLQAKQQRTYKQEIDRLIGEVEAKSICSKARAQFDASLTARAAEMAPVAKAFVSSCGPLGVHMADLERYSNIENMRALSPLACGEANWQSELAIRALSPILTHE